MPSNLGTESPGAREACATRSLPRDKLDPARRPRHDVGNGGSKTYM